MQTETEGIVLRHVKTAAGRTMLLIFSQKYGKISVGTSLTDKNSKSKSSLAIRPFTYGRYELYKGREIYNLNGAETKRSFYSFGENIDKYIAASIALELTEKVLTEEVPEPRIFSLLVEFLKQMEKRSTAFSTLLLAYEVKLLYLLGNGPVLDRCAICGGPVTHQKDESGNRGDATTQAEVSADNGHRAAPKFSVRDGGIICENCALELSKKFTENPHTRDLSRLIYQPKFDIVSTLRYFAEKPLSAFEKIALNESTADELKEIMREYFSYHLEVGPLKSESML